MKALDTLWRFIAGMKLAALLFFIGLACAAYVGALHAIGRHPSAVSYAKFALVVLVAGAVIGYVGHDPRPEDLDEDDY